MLGDLGGEIFVLDAGHIKHVARLDSPFTSPPIGVPAFYAHAAQRKAELLALMDERGIARIADLVAGQRG